MATTFNAEEILEIACQIERNGAAFYRAAANLVSLQDSQKLLLELADMEDGHELTFTHMKDQQTNLDELFSDPDGMAAMYLRAIASNHVFVSDVQPSDQFDETTSARDVLKIALQAEFASIAYFQGLLDFLPEAFGKEKLQSIILEEQEHVVIINKKIIALNSKENSV